MCNFLHVIIITEKIQKQNTNFKGKIMSKYQKRTQHNNTHQNVIITTGIKLKNILMVVLGIAAIIVTFAISFSIILYPKMQHRELQKIYQQATVVTSQKQLNEALKHNNSYVAVSGKLHGKPIGNNVFNHNMLFISQYHTENDDKTVMLMPNGAGGYMGMTNTNSKEVNDQKWQTTGFYIFNYKLKPTNYNFTNVMEKGKPNKVLNYPYHFTVIRNNIDISFLAKVKNHRLTPVNPDREDREQKQIKIYKMNEHQFEQKFK